jgi:hypothetical protein
MSDSEGPLEGGALQIEAARLLLSPGLIVAIIRGEAYAGNNEA